MIGSWRKEEAPRSARFCLTKDVPPITPLIRHAFVPCVCAWCCMHVCVCVLSTCVCFLSFIDHHCACVCAVAVRFFPWPFSPAPAIFLLLVHIRLCYLPSGVRLFLLQFNGGHVKTIYQCRLHCSSLPLRIQILFLRVACRRRGSRPLTYVPLSPLVSALVERGMLPYRARSPSPRGGSQAFAPRFFLLTASPTVDTSGVGDRDAERPVLFIWAHALDC
jgi:hypothetical protein